MYKKSIILSFLVLIISAGTVYATGAGEVGHPVNGFLSILPLLVILGLLFARVHMLIAGLAGGILAMVIGGISIAEANGFMLEALPTMLTITVPIINSAIAMAVFKSGGYTTALTLVRRGIRGKVEYFAAFIVFLQAAATYMSGIGGGSAMVIAPLAFAAVGAIPELIAGMSIAAAVSFTTSPASLNQGWSPNWRIYLTGYVSTMRPYWILFTILGITGILWCKEKKGHLPRRGK